MTPQIIATLGPADWTAENVLCAERLTAAHAAIATVGYDGVYLPQGPDLYEPLELAAYIAVADSSPLRIYVAQRAGLVAPTMCSRMFATLDQLTKGKIVAVLDADSDTASEGDALAQGQKISRALEYAQIMHDLWATDKPLDHAGVHYTFNKGRTNVPPLQKSALPILLGCAADAEFQSASTLSGVMLSDKNLTPTAVARFTTRGLRVAVVLHDAPEHMPATIAAYFNAGADTFMIAPATSHAAMVAGDPHFVARCRAAAIS